MHDDLLARRADYPILERTAGYLINNSLGAMHRDSATRLAEYADLWNTDGVSAWSTWFPEMGRVADLLGTIIGAALGVLIITTIDSGLVFYNVNLNYSEFVTGIVIIGAIALDRIAKRRRAP